MESKRYAGRRFATQRHGEIIPDAGMIGQSATGDSHRGRLRQVGDVPTRSVDHHGAAAGVAGTAGFMVATANAKASTRVSQDAAGAQSGGENQNPEGQEDDSGFLHMRVSIGARPETIKCGE